MNLWRKSKSWFQDSFPSQKESFEPQDYLEREKNLVKTKYEQERALIEKQFHYDMLESKLRFEHELRRLKFEHVRLKAKSNREISNENLENDSGLTTNYGKLSKNDKASPVKTLVDNGLDGLEWDPINELRNYSNESETIQANSWETLSEISAGDCFEQSKFPESAYGSISTEIRRKSGEAERKIFKASDVERKIDELRHAIKHKLALEYDEKFQAERKFLYSVIDELEENVALLRKQKEDIVTIFEAQDERKELIDN